MTLPVSTAVLFYSDSGVADPFTLDSATSGVLDSDALEGITPVDITSDVYAIRVDRGRSRWLDDFQAGTCSITLDNRTRTYDPTGGGTYSTDIVPGKRFRVTSGGTPIFDGTADDWDIAYSLGGDSVASVVISDGFSDLGHTILTETATTSQLSGARLTAILDRADVNFPTAYRDIAAGVTTLQADTIADGTDVASYAQLIARTEGGRLFMAADGDLTFRDRYETQTVAGALKFADDGTGVPYYGIQVAVGSELLFNRALVTRVGGTQQTADNLTSQDSYGVRTLEYGNLTFRNRYETQTTTGALKFADDGTGVPFYGLSVAVGSELLYNRSLITRTGGSEQAADNTSSQDSYGVRTLAYTGLLFNSDADSLNFAQYLVSRYGTPEVRISGLAINLHALDATQAGNVVGTELGDVIQVLYSPPGGGTAIDVFAVVDKISHEIGPQHHMVTFGLSATSQAFTLDSAVFGKLDGDYALGY